MQKYTQVLYKIHNEVWAYFSDVNNKSINLSELLTLGIVKEVDGDSEDLTVDKSFKSQHNTKKCNHFQ